MSKRQRPPEVAGGQQLGLPTLPTKADALEAEYRAAWKTSSALARAWGDTRNPHDETFAGPVLAADLEVARTYRAWQKELGHDVDV